VEGDRILLFFMVKGSYGVAERLMEGSVRIKWYQARKI